MTEKQLLNKLAVYEDKLRAENERMNAVLERQGWGYGMRCVKAGVSFRKYDAIKAKIADIKSQLDLLKS